MGTMYVSNGRNLWVQCQTQTEAMIVQSRLTVLYPEDGPFTITEDMNAQSPKSVQHRRVPTVSQ